MIKFNENRIFQNKSYKYLFPLVRNYGLNFITRFNNVMKLGVFIKDMNYSNPRVKSHCLYFVIKSPDENNVIKRYEFELNAFNDFVEFVKYQQYYVTHYPIDINKYVFVLKVNSELNQAIDEFIGGRFSKMFTKEDVINYYPLIKGDSQNAIDYNEKIIEKRMILLHDNAYAQTYLDKVNENFETKLTLEDIVNWEFDEKPNMQNEVLNY